jgi:hypothetical protein
MHLQRQIVHLRALVAVGGLPEFTASRDHWPASTFACRPTGHEGTPHELLMKLRFVYSGRKALDVLATSASSLADEMPSEARENRRCASKAAARSMRCFQMRQRHIFGASGRLPPTFIRC